MAKSKPRCASCGRTFASRGGLKQHIMEEEPWVLQANHHHEAIERVTSCYVCGERPYYYGVNWGRGDGTVSLLVYWGLCARCRAEGEEGPSEEAVEGMGAHVEELEE